MRESTQTRESWSFKMCGILHRTKRDLKIAEQSLEKMEF